MKLERVTVDQILQKSKDGEGVADALRSMGINVHEGLIYLRDYHHDEIKAAKKTQIELRK